MKQKFRVFLGYRYNTEGYDFVNDLYQAIKKEDDELKTKYGEVYLSTDVDIHGNFLDLTHLENGVEYFIIPYTENFFESNSKKEEKPVIIKEIEAALRGGCKKFVAIFFDETLPSNISEFYKKQLSIDVHDKIHYVTGAKQNFYSDEIRAELISSILEYLRIKTTIKDYIEKQNMNVFMSTKDKIQAFPLAQRLYGVKKLTFLNFAGTSFISGINIAEQYKNDEMSDWFKRNILSGNIDVDIILTNPKSYADIDASLYKMNPEKKNSLLKENYTLGSENYSGKELHQFIIRENFNTICDFKLRHNKENIKIYYTDIALPYGIMKSEFNIDKKELNNMLINIYSPLIHDADRPTFFLFEQNKYTEELYKIFNNSLIEILDKSENAVEFSGHPNVDFLFEKPLVHRANINNLFEPLSRDAIKECAEREFPIEVDLIITKKKILVWRNEKNRELYKDKKYHLLDYPDELIDAILKEDANNNGGCSQIITLEEMLNLVMKTAEKKGKKPIPLLIEIKENWNREIDKTLREKVIRVCRILENYKGEYALHSANPNVVRIVKNYDVKIPCGQITLDFSKSDYKNEISDEYIKLHNEAMYYDLVIPDFLSCNINDFKNNKKYKEKKAKYGLRDIGWTVKSLDEYIEAPQYYDNFLTEYIID